MWCIWAQKVKEGQGAACPSSSAWRMMAGPAALTVLDTGLATDSSKVQNAFGVSLVGFERCTFKTVKAMGPAAKY